MKLKILWIILVIAQFALGIVYIVDIPAFSIGNATKVFLVAMPVIFVSTIFLVFVRKRVEQGKEINNYILVIAFIASLFVVRYLGSDILGIVVLVFWPFFYIASVFLSVVYGIIIFKPKH